MLIFLFIYFYILYINIFISKAFVFFYVNILSEITIQWDIGKLLGGTK